MAWRYGVSGTVDAYQLAFTVVTWFPMLLTAAATVVLVPRLVDLARSPPLFRQFVKELNGTALLVGVALTAVTGACAPSVVAWLLAAPEPETARTAMGMAIGMAPIALFATVSTVLAARLQARQKFAYSALEAIPALTLIVFVVLAPALAVEGPLIWGTVAGFLMQALLLAGMARRYDGSVIALALWHRSPQWKSLYGPVMIMLLGSTIMSSTLPIDQAFAAALGEGAVATLGYANRIVGLLTSFSQIVVARALLPVMADVVAGGDHELGRQQSIKWSWLMFAAGALVALLSWVLAPVAVAALFERGAFSSRDTSAVVAVFRYGLLQVAPFFGAIVLVQWLAVANRHRVIFAIAIPAFLVKLTLNALLTARMGIAGIMVATAAMYLVTFVMMRVMVGGRRELPPA